MTEKELAVLKELRLKGLATYYTVMMILFTVLSCAVTIGSAFIDDYTIFGSFAWVFFCPILCFSLGLGGFSVQRSNGNTYKAYNGAAFPSDIFFCIPISHNAVYTYYFRTWICSVIMIDAGLLCGFAVRLATGTESRIYDLFGLYYLLMLIYTAIMFFDIFSGALCPNKAYKLRKSRGYGLIITANILIMTIILLISSFMQFFGSESDISGLISSLPFGFMFGAAGIIIAALYTTAAVIIFRKAVIGRKGVSWYAE